MKTLVTQMSIYQRYHTKPFTKLTHFIGVPMIILAILLFLQLLPLQLFTTFLLGILLLYYLFLDWMIGFVTALWLMLMFWVANKLGQFPAMIFILASVLFIVGWMAQGLGHYHEQKRPALLDNFFQVFIAPIFLTAEIFFLLGYRKNLQQKILSLSRINQPIN